MPLPLSRVSRAPKSLAPIARIDVVGGLVPLASASSSIKDCPIEREGREEKKRKKNSAIVKKIAEVGVLQEALWKGELILTGSQAALALEEERRKNAEVRIAKLKDETLRYISEVKVQAVEFKVSSEMMDLNIAFTQEAFQKAYELCEDRVAGKFSKLDLSFLYGDVFDEETGPSAITVDPYPVEAALEPSELAVEASEPMLEPEVVPEALGYPTAPPFESAKLALGSMIAAGVLSSSPISPPKSPINADPLPQGIPLKAHLKYLRKEVHQLKKKLKKIEDELQKFREHALEAITEVTHLRKLHMRDYATEVTRLRKLHMRDYASVAIRKSVFEKELAELKKNTSDKSWALTAKVCSLELSLKQPRRRFDY
ncbi:hypothetical protein COCNU_contig69376565G000010 [Cocos nucifera]|nr:hypothetical protein [Cocos nucifera]